MIQNSQVILNEQEVLNYYKQNYRTKICREIRFEDTLDDKAKKEYQKFNKSCCCVKPLSIMIYSIIILAFAFVGFFFSISKNKGYKSYKEILDKNISLIENKYPNELETLRLLNFLSIDQSDFNCTYDKYSFGLCFYGDYKDYCTKEKYEDNICNYMDRQINQGFSFVCNFKNYNGGKCNPVQYYDYLQSINVITNETKAVNIKSYEAEINFTTVSLAKKFSEFGNYDQPIYLSFIILMIIFIILLIFDLKTNKKTNISGVKYYLILIFYMFYYVIFRVYIILFLALSIYGIIITMLHPSTDYNSNIGTEADPFLNGDKDILFPWEKLWKEKRINAIIFCGISFILFFMVMILSLYKRLIYDFLSFNFYEKNEADKKQIIRNASIKIGVNCYGFKIKQNKELYLNENRKNKKHYFKEVIFQNNVYFLKCDNLGLKNQLCWSEFNHPNTDEVIKYFGKILNLFFINALILIANEICKMENGIYFDYCIHLIDLGYKPKNYKNIKNNFKLIPLFFKIFDIAYLLYGIIIMIYITKFTLFGGFKNIIFNRLSIFLAVIIVLLNLAVGVLAVIGGVYDILGFLAYSKIKIIKFDDHYILFMNTYKNIFIFVIIFLVSAISFFISIKMVPIFNKVKNENQRLVIEHKNSEDEFKYISLNGENFVLEAENNNQDLPKHLFYQKNDNQNPIFEFIPNMAQSSDIILCLEKNKEELFDEKQKEELCNYKYKFINTKRIIAKIIYNIIIISFSVAFAILALVFSFGNNKHYKAYKKYIDQIDQSLLTGYIKFYFSLGNFENYVLISFLLVGFIFLIFEIISLIIHKKKCNIKYNLILFMNVIFYILFKIYFPLFLFLFIYSFLVFVGEPYDELKIYNNDSIAKKLDEEFQRKKLMLYINFIAKLVLIFLISSLIKVKYCIIDYLNKNYEENEDEEEDINKGNIESNEISTSIIINNCSYIAKIKLNEILILQKIDSIGKEQIYKFKKIKIENVVDNFIFVRLGFNSITDQISLADWNYPDLNLILNKLCEMCNNIYYILFFSFPLFKLHVKEEIKYQSIKNANGIYDQLNTKKPIFSSIFNKYGSLEKKFTELRFILFIFQIVILLLFMIKRIYYGGFNKYVKLTLSFILSIIAFIKNLLFVILDFGIILFTILSIISFQNNVYYEIASNKDDNNMELKFYLQVIINIIISIFNIKLLKICKGLISDLKKLRKEMLKFNKLEDNIDDANPNFKPLEFKYVSLEGIVCSIKEVRNNLLQRYLFYSSEDLSDSEKTQANINPIEINKVNSEQNSKNKRKINEKIKGGEDNSSDLSSVSRKKLVS